MCCVVRLTRKKPCTFLDSELLSGDRRALGKKIFFWWFLLPVFIACVCSILAHFFHYLVSPSSTTRSKMPWILSPTTVLPVLVSKASPRSPRVSFAVSLRTASLRPALLLRPRLVVSKGLLASVAVCENQTLPLNKSKYLQTFIITLSWLVATEFMVSTRFRPNGQIGSDFAQTALVQQ